MNDVYSLVTDEPELLGEEGWSPIAMPSHDTGGSSFVEGDPNGDRIRIRLFVRESDRRLFARVWLGPGAEGPPRHSHGGSVAAVLDHCMGVSSWVAGHPVVAATITVNFHHKLPLRVVATVEAWVEAVEGRKVSTAGRIYIPDRGESFSSSTGLFIEQSLDKFKGLMPSGLDSEEEPDFPETIQS